MFANGTEEFKLALHETLAEFNTMPVSKLLRCQTVSKFLHKCYCKKYEVDYPGIKVPIQKVQKITNQQDIRNYYLRKEKDSLKLIIMRTNWHLRTWRLPGNTLNKGMKRVKNTSTNELNQSNVELETLSDVPCVDFTREVIVTQKESIDIDTFIKYIFYNAKLFDGNELDIRVPSLTRQGFLCAAFTLILTDEQCQLDFNDKQVIKQLILTCPRK